MKVFLGWSGDTSHKVALALRPWLPRVIQTIVPYVSSEDIAKGARWASDIAKELQASRFGIICVTRDNASSPWINFEAGSLSREIEQAFVSPFLFDLKPSEINGPLSQFQHTANSKDDLKKLIFTINDKKEHVLQKDALEDAFEMCWPKLETSLAEIKREGANRPVPEKRDPQSMLEELLEQTRASRLDYRERSLFTASFVQLLHEENKSILENVLATLSTLARNAELHAQLETPGPDAVQAVMEALKKNKSAQEWSSIVETFAKSKPAQQWSALMEQLSKERWLDSIRKPTSGMPPPPEPEPDE
jgi:hypothetical protein